MNRSLRLVLLSIFIVGLSIFCWVNRYNIYDYIELRGYTPPLEIAALADDASFTDYAKRLFYVNKPRISDRDTFNTQCNHYEQTIVLGCYTGRNIYIFDVTEERLEGVEQVTAAHEMLHVAYDRLSASDRSHIDKLIGQLFDKLDNDRLNTLAQNYEKQQPGSVPNELHSIIPTEVEDIGGELEEYYSRYFFNRKQVVGYAQKYEQVFNDLKNQVKQYDSQLQQKRGEILALENELDLLEQQIQAQKQQMDSLLARGQVNAYNALVEEYNIKIRTYNEQVAFIKVLIEDYNQLVAVRNSIVVEQQNLAESIDSRPSLIEE